LYLDKKATQRCDDSGNKRCVLAIQRKVSEDGKSYKNKKASVFTEAFSNNSSSN